MADRDSAALLSERLEGEAVWLSGGHGFIGSRLAEFLAGHGARVALFDGDVRDRGAVAASVASASPGLLYNLAAPVDVSRDPTLGPLMDAVIVDGALAVHAAAAALPQPPLLVQVGTCEEYGTIVAPFHEDAEPSEPVSPYAAAKLRATRELLALHDPEGVRVVVARPFLTYGPGLRRPMLIPAAVNAALRRVPFPMTEGLQTREFNYVDDTAIGLARIAAAPSVEGRIVNVAGGDERPVVDVVRLVFELAEAPPDLLRPGALPERPGEVPRFFADVARCRDMLGHVPSVGLREGLRRTIAAARTSRLGGGAT